MDARKLIEILGIAENLKNNTRHCWTSKGRRESVAEHSWRIALFAYFLKDEFPEADMDKVVKMCIFHDMGEAFTGDIPAFDKTLEDEKEESRQLYAWVDSLPQPYKVELRALYEEMDALETLEAKIYKAIDKLEAIIQHNESDLSTWIPLEYTANLDYGNESVAFNEYLTKLRKEIYNDTIKKLNNKGK